MAEFKIGKMSEVSPGESKVFKVGDKTVAVFNVCGIFYAISDICRYGGDSLSSGKLDGYIVKCLKHDYEYDVQNGKCKTQAGMNIESFPIRTQNDEIVISIRRPRDFDNWKANYRKKESLLE